MLVTINTSIKSTRVLITFQQYYCCSLQYCVETEIMLQHTGYIKQMNQLVCDLYIIVHCAFNSYSRPVSARRAFKPQLLYIECVRVHRFLCITGFWRWLIGWQVGWLVLVQVESIIINNISSEMRRTDLQTKWCCH